jgi:hypothetical protein
MGFLSAYSTRFFAKLAVAFFDSQCEATRHSVHTWTLVGLRLKLLKDLRHTIAKLVLASRVDAKFFFFFSFVRALLATEETAAAFLTLFMQQVPLLVADRLEYIMVLVFFNKYKLHPKIFGNSKNDLESFPLQGNFGQLFRDGGCNKLMVIKDCDCDA